MAQPSTESPAGEPLGSQSLVERTLGYVESLLVLSIVPLATSLLNVGDLLATAQSRGMSVKAAFPVYRYDLWSFVDAPDAGLSVSVPLGTLESVGLIVPLLAVYLVLSGTMSAGYFGSIADGITTGSFDFVANIRQFAVRMIVLEVLIVVGILVVFLPLLLVPPLFVLALIALLIVAYLLFPTVYVLVLEDRGIESAVRRAYGLVDEHQPLGFFLGLVIATVLCSIPVSFLAYSGLLGAIGAAMIAALLGLSFNIATALKVAEMADIAVIN